MPRKKLRYLCRAIHHGRTIADPHPDPNETAEFPVYSPAERQADTVVHIVGLTLGLAGCAGLAAAVLLRPDAGPRLTLALGLYAVGLMAMLVGSALYNLTDAAAPARKRLFRRLDHAAIFLMIAGTYTPFTLVAIGGAWGAGLLAFVWAVAAAGIAAELLSLRRHDGLAVAMYLLLGWSILPALVSVPAALSPSGVALLAAGGVLYSVGAGFHLWRSLPFQNAVWHGFVLAAAACHYTAVLREVAAA
jgi:hemolysin III